jgi:GNAT superfamily N-acetyltransferase
MMDVRAAREEEREAIVDLTLAAYQEYAPVIPDLWDGYRDNIIHTLADPRPGEQIVAEQDGQLVGAVLLYPAGVTVSGPDGQPLSRPWPEVRLLAVIPAARGQGIGMALMRACLARARQAGAATITLHTSNLMEAAMHLYERMGFRRAPEAVTTNPGSPPVPSASSVARFPLTWTARAA